jgi:Kef-type K+ transport system membrane component KefB
MADALAWVNNITSSFPDNIGETLLVGLGKTVPLLAAATESEDTSMVLPAVLLSLVIVYFASKVGGEVSNKFGLPPVLGELVGGVIVGVSALHLLVFPEGAINSSDSLLMTFLQATGVLSPAAAEATFKAQSEVISVLSELGVIILLFEIGLESNLKELMAVGIQATVVAFVGVAVPFAAGTAGLMIIFGVPAIPAIFAGAALTATSIGITSKVLSEIGRLNSREGQIIIGAAVIDDLLSPVWLKRVKLMSSMLFISSSVRRFSCWELFYWDVSLMMGLKVFRTD